MPDRPLMNATARDAIAWLATHARWFDPDTVTLPGRRTKPVVELAVLVRALRDAGADHPGLDELAAVVRKVTARPEPRRLPRPTRAQVVAGAFLFGAAHRGADDDPIEHRRLQHLVDLRLLETLEQPAHRVMEDRLAMEWAGLRASLPSWQALADRSILGARPNPSFVDEAGAYQLTHAVMYVTAFGTRPFSLRGHPDDGTRQLLSTLLVRFVADRHWDLVGELLLSWALLDRGTSPVCEAAWTVLLRALDGDGSLAQPRRDGDPEPGIELDAAFQDRYHPTLVLALAADTWARKDPGAVPRHGGASRVIDTELLRELAGVEASWIASKLGDPEPRVLCDALVALWICGALCPSAPRRMPDASVQVAERLREVDDWTRVPIGLAMVTSGLLASGPGIPAGLAAYVELAAEVLRSAPDDDGLAEKRSLLHALGRADAPRRAALDSVVAAAEAAALDPTPAKVDRLLRTSESCAAHGAQPVELGAAEAWVPELLVALAAQRAHTYDLVTASRLTRACVHLSPHAPGVADLAGVVITQAAAVEPQSRLPVLVEVLWTVAEAATSWRLMSAIGSAARRGLSPRG